jgi:thioredoxin 1
MVLFLGALIGGLLGYGFYRLAGCKDGACPLTSSPRISVFYGVLAGVFFVYSSVNAVGCSRKTEEAANPYVKTFTTDDWEKEVLKSEKPVLVDFWAPWCGPCRIQGPIVDKLAEEMKDSALVGKLNVDIHGKIAGQYGIRSIPTLLVIRGGKVQNQFTGVTGEDTLRTALKKGK